MHYAKLSSLLVLSVTALMLVVASASATTLTSPAGTLYTGEIKASSEGHVIFHSENAPTAFTIECNGTIAGTVTQHGANPITASGSVSSLAFNNCTNGATFVVNKAGTLEVHTDSAGVIDGNGTVTSSGTELTVHVPVLNIKCIYTTSNTDIGTLTGSASTQGTATLDINSSTIPRTGGSAFCGTGNFWTGSYKITTPTYLAVD